MQLVAQYDAKAAQRRVSLGALLQRLAHWLRNRLRKQRAQLHDGERHSAANDWMGKARQGEAHRHNSKKAKTRFLVFGFFLSQAQAQGVPLEDVRVSVVSLFH